MSALRKPDPHSAIQSDDGLQLLSAALDGEATQAETEACMAALKHDGGLRQTWSDYHLVGDLMRGVAPLPDDFMARFSAQLADEPTVLAPRRSAWPQRVAVVSFASLAVWGMVSLTGLMSEAPVSAPLALAPGFQPAMLAADEARDDARYAAYMVVHQEFAPMAVVSPYQRVVAVSAESR